MHRKSWSESASKSFCMIPFLSELLDLSNMFERAELKLDLVFRQLRARRALSLCKDVPLRTRMALSLYKVNGNSALLVLNRTSLNSDSALLALN